MRIVLKIPAGWPAAKVVALVQLLTELVPHNPRLEGFDIMPLALASEHDKYKSAFATYRAQCRDQYGSVAAAILATEAVAPTNTERQKQ